jgi:hypothetical protein
MVKKIFALGSVTALVGLVATVAAAGCSSTVTSTNTTTDDGGGDVKVVKPPVEGGPEDDSSTPAVPEEGTVGKTCTADTDCNKAGTKNDNVCSKGVFNGEDFFGTPVCVQPSCTQGTSGMVSDVQCDDGAGLCLVSTGSTKGVCLPYCEYTSTTGAKCEGGNKCAIRYIGLGTTPTAIGSCQPACQSDADCKGTAGEKCQVETGYCHDPAKIVKYAKNPGEACDGAATTAQCVCNRVGGTGANMNKGICTRACLTGTAGDGVCNTAVAGWKCSAKLPKTDSMGKAEFTAQPADVLGECALPCATAGTDTDCIAALGATGTPVKCKAFAEGNFCETTDM